MIGIDLKPELEEMVKLIGDRNSYSGNKISDSIMNMFTVEITELHDGILVPYWLGVLERGRGPRKSNVSSDLYKKIYRWMEKRNMFLAEKPVYVKGIIFGKRKVNLTQEEKIRQAKQMTYYINKYGNQQFRSKVFVDVYNSVRKQTIEKIEKKFSQQISKITMDVL
jgi:hypothetical protein